MANTNNSGPHGFSEILYAYTSGTGNNGSAFAGINANTPWYNLTIGLAMLIGRFLFMIPAARGRRKPCGEERDSPQPAALFPRTDPVRRPADRHRCDYRRADVLPGAFSGPICRTLPDAGRQIILMSTTLTPPEQTPSERPSVDTSDITSLLPKKLAKSRPLFDPEILSRAIMDSFRKLNPVTLAKNPGDLRCRSGRGDDHRHLGPRHAFTAPRARVSRCRSPCGCGSPCCSRTSPKPWRKRAAKRRPIRCAKPRPTAWRRRFCPTDRRKRSRRPSCARATSSSAKPSDIIPGDGDVIDGIATVDESVITGESAPVIRESGGDRSAVTGGTKVLSD